jgi:hypothetical protein
MKSEKSVIVVGDKFQGFSDKHDHISRRWLSARISATGCSSSFAVRVSTATHHAYGDHISDLPMLLAVQHPHVVDPCPSLRETAMQRGWPILTSGVIAEAHASKTLTPANE